MHTCKPCRRCDGQATDEYVASWKRGICQPCYRADRKQWYAKNRVREKRRGLVWRTANTDKMKACVKAWVTKNPDYHRIWQRENRLSRYLSTIKCKYGVTKEQYREMSERQNHSCAICGNGRHTDSPLVVDHCHDTDRVRGLLCGTCNSGIGFLKHDPRVLQQAAAYCAV